MRNSGETQQITNMDELIEGIQILFRAEALTSVAREAAASLVDELVEFKGERGLDILRALESPYMVSSRFASLCVVDGRDRIASVYPAC